MCIFIKAKVGIRDAQESRGLGDVYRGQVAALVSVGVTAVGSVPVLAVDVGGTKLEAGLVDADGCVLARRLPPIHI